MKGNTFSYEKREVGLLGVRTPWQEESKRPNHKMHHKREQKSRDQCPWDQKWKKTKRRGKVLSKIRAQGGERGREIKGCSERFFQGHQGEWVGVGKYRMGGDLGGVNLKKRGRFGRVLELVRIE